MQAKKNKKLGHFFTFFWPMLKMPNSWHKNSSPRQAKKKYPRKKHVKGW